MGAGFLQIVVPWAGQAELGPSLLALTALNRSLMRRHNWPALYTSGIRYQREPRGPDGIVREAWCSYPVMLYRWRKSRTGSDCEDLACARAAELQLKGIAATAIAVRSGVGWHIVVRHPDGTIEDPSKALGM